MEDTFAVVNEEGVGVEITPGDDDDATVIKIIEDGVEEAKEVEKDIEAAAESYEFEDEYNREVHEEIETIVDEDFQEIKDDLFLDEAKEELPIDQMTELDPPVFVQNESPQEGISTSGESVEMAGTMSEYDEEVLEETDILDEHQEDLEVTNMIEATIEELGSDTLEFEDTDTMSTVLPMEKDELEKEVNEEVTPSGEHSSLEDKIKNLFK